MARGNVRIDIDIEVPPEVIKQLHDNEEQIAKMIESKAKTTSVFMDKTGRLRRSIKAKFDNKIDGWKIQATAPHAFVVEFGHGGPHAAAPKSYLRSAKESVLGQI